MMLRNGGKVVRLNKFSLSTSPGGNRFTLLNCYVCGFNYTGNDRWSKPEISGFLLRLNAQDKTITNHHRRGKTGHCDGYSSFERRVPNSRFSVQAPCAIKTSRPFVRRDSSSSGLRGTPRSWTGRFDNDSRRSIAVRYEASLCAKR